MQEYTYKKKCIPVKDMYDVIVVGGGTAGSTAAIAAAMEGANTLLVERNCFLGGSASGGQVTPMMHTGIPENADSSFINKMIKERLRKENYGARDPYENDGWFNPEMLKFTLEEIYLEQGGHLLYDTGFLDSIVEDGVIKGVVVHNKGGIQAASGHMVIDCTGDADVAYSAGVPCRSGDEANHENQLSSLRFMLGNVDILKLDGYLRSIGEPMALEYPLFEMASVWEWDRPLVKIFKQAVEDGVLRYEDGMYFQAFSVPGMKGVLSFNCPEVQNIFDSLNPESRTGIIINAKKMIKRLYEFMKSRLPGFEDSYIASVASIPGIRESRRIVGKYVLGEKDYNDRSKFADAIARTAYPVDIHGTIDEKTLDVKPFSRGEHYEIPFRCLVPVNVDNLLAGGRCISATFAAQSSVRIQATCRATGEAAGIAAAYCSKNRLNLKDFNGEIVRRIMIEHGALLS